MYKGEMGEREQRPAMPRLSAQDKPIVTRTLSFTRAKLSFIEMLHPHMQTEAADETLDITYGL